jgi:hypothetical protein
MFDRPDRPQRLGLCANGHVTDPDVDIDIRTGTPITSHAWDVLRHRVLGDLERGSDAWTQLCWVVPRRWLRRSTSRTGRAGPVALLDPFDLDTWEGDRAYVCSRGHVTPVSREDAVRLGYHQTCRRVAGYPGPLHQCSLPVAQLDADPARHAAWVLGGEAAVAAIMIQVEDHG